MKTDIELITFLESKIKDSANPDWKQNYSRILYFYKKGLRCRENQNADD